MLIQVRLNLRLVGNLNNQVPVLGFGLGIFGSRTRFIYLAQLKLGQLQNSKPYFYFLFYFSPLLKCRFNWNLNVKKLYEKVLNRHLIIITFVLVDDDQRERSLCSSFPLGQVTQQPHLSLQGVYLIEMTIFHSQFSLLTMCLDPLIMTKLYYRLLPLTTI